MAKSSYSKRSQIIIDLLKDQGCVYQPGLARLFGVKEGVFLSRLIYWDGKGADPEWIWKTQDDWYMETGLSRYEQEAVRQGLIDLGVIEEKLRGVPGKLHFKIHWETLVEALSELVYPEGESPCLGGHPKLARDSTSDKIVIAPRHNTGVTPGATSLDTKPLHSETEWSGEGGRDGESGQVSNGADGPGDRDPETAGEDAGGGSEDSKRGTVVGDVGQEPPDRRPRSPASGPSGEAGSTELSDSPVVEGSGETPAGTQGTGGGTGPPGGGGVEASAADGASAGPNRGVSAGSGQPVNRDQATARATQSARISKALRGTLTGGDEGVDDRPPLSNLAAFIHQEMRSWVPSGQQTKLAQGYTEILPGGSRKHPSPDVLWATDSMYPQYVQERISYWRGQGGSPAQRRARLINQLCAYRGNHYAWLEWRERQGGRMIPESELTGSRMEAV